MRSFARSGALLLMALTTSCASKADYLLACLSPEGGGTLVVRVRNELPHQVYVSNGTTEIGCCSADNFTLEVIGADGSPLKRCGFADSFGLLRKVPLESGDEITYRYSAVSLSGLYCGIDLSQAQAQITYGMKTSLPKNSFSQTSVIASKCSGR